LVEISRAGVKSGPAERETARAQHRK